MKPQELAELIAAGDVETKMIEAIGQRAVRHPRGWDWEFEAAVCECGLLLIALPRPVTITRIVVTLGRAMPVQYPMTHAHVADERGRLLCMECVADAGDPCPGHDAEMCDTPTAFVCESCTDAALPGRDHCLDHRPYELDWDKDRYLGLM